MGFVEDGFSILPKTIVMIEEADIADGKQLVFNLRCKGEVNVVIVQVIVAPDAVKLCKEIVDEEYEVDGILIVKKDDAGSEFFT